MPHVSVTLAYALAVASVVGLIVFLAHLVQTIRVESMLRSVREDAESTAFARARGSRGCAHRLESLRPSGASTVITAPSSGFLVQVREGDLLEAAVRDGLVVVLDVRPGDWIVADPGGRVWGIDAGAQAVARDVAEALRASLVTGFERSSSQDVALGVRQLTDVAVKALSPGINDPTTAVHALGHSSALLCMLARRDLGPRVLCDDEGRVRVVLARPDLSSLLRLALDQPTRYGAEEPALLERSMKLLRELAWVCAPHQHRDVELALDRLLAVIQRADLAPEDKAWLAEGARPVRRALAGDWDGTSEA